MRKKLLPIVALVLGALSFASCQKESVDHAALPPRTITMNLTFSPEVETNGLESRTAFDPDANKVVIKDQETVAVGVIPSAQNQTAWEMATDTEGNTPIRLHQRVDNQKFETTVRHTGAQGAYDYFFVHPAPTLAAALSGVGTTSNHKLPREQTPSVDGVTFDPQGDILIGKMLTITETSATNAMEVTFKRLFVPFKVTLTDVDGLINGEAVKSVEFSAPGASTPLSGAFSVQHSAQAAEITYAMSATPSEVFRSVKASYASQLAKNADGTYNVWYVVNPTTLHGNLTVEVTTSTRTLTCLVAPGDPVIEQGKLNTVTVKMNKVNTTIKPIAEPDLKALYDAGETIYIGGVAVNKAVYGDSKTPAPGNLAGTGVVFLKDASEGAYLLNSHPKGLVLLPMEGAKPLVNVTAYKQLQGNFLCKGITFISTVNGYMLNSGPLVADAFVLDQCDITHIHNLTYFNDAGVPKINIIRNCKIKFTTGACRIINFGAKVSTVAADITKVEFVDNVVYSPENVIINGGVCVADETVTGFCASIVVNNNTFINYLCSSMAFVAVPNASTIEVRNNLLWAGDAAYTGTLSGYLFKGLLKTGNPPDPLPTAVVGRNFKYAPRTGINYQLLPSSSLWTPSGLSDEPMNGDVDPFNAADGGTFDRATGTFIPADAYKQYGARTW